MKIAQINMIPYGSTGAIMFQIAEMARDKGFEVRTYSTIPFDKKRKNIHVDSRYHYVFGSFADNKTHYYLGSTFGKNGCYSKKGTKQLISYLEEFKPDIVHLHNLHKFCINLPILFGYLKKSSVKVVWTLHDCWSFTGKCPHFVIAKCDKWRTVCHNCPQVSGYPMSRVDNSKKMYQNKMKWFTGIENMTLVTPSYWLSGLVKQSFLKNYPVEVIYNGIDLDVFKPIKGNFKQGHGLQDKKIILGVSLGWSNKKGLDVFVELAKRLGNDYTIILIGTDDDTDKLLPVNVLSIHRTHDQTQLAEIYTAADVFVNPTREEVLGLVNIEALACGTPVVIFKTGGCPEILDENSGSVVECDDIDAMEREVRRVAVEKPYTQVDCINRAKQFDKKDKFAEYCELYERILSK